VFIIVLENESESTSFGPGAPSPYLAQTLPSMGVFVPNYYAVGHSSLDNYIALVSGQAPNAQTKADCSKQYDEFKETGVGPYEQAEGEGCVYPASVKTLAGQLEGAGDTWKGYMQSMPRACAHATLNGPDEEQGDGTLAEPFDTYATRHDPFVWFKSVTEDNANCEAHVVNLSALTADLSSAASTPNLSFITPDVCYDGHESEGKCVNVKEPAGFAGINAFLSEWVPRIVGSPAFQQDGLLLVTFDEAAGSDTSSCCGETTSGGGDIGAVLVSPFIKAGTTTTLPYNHYSTLASIEGLFSLPLLGDAAEPGTTTFGSDVFNLAATPTPIGTVLPGAPAPVAPRLTDVSESVKLWREGRALAHISSRHKPPVGTTFTFDLDQSAAVTFAFTEPASGRTVAHRCVAQTRRNRRMRSCTRSVPAGTLKFAAHAGKNQVRFDGLISRHTRLAPGKDAVVITAASAGGLSRPQTLHFTIANGQ